MRLAAARFLVEKSGENTPKNFLEKSFRFALTVGAEIAKSAAHRRGRDGRQGPNQRVPGAVSGVSVFCRLDFVNARLTRRGFQGDSFGVPGSLTIEY